MIPGIDDTMFTVSVKYDVVALDASTNNEDTSVQLNQNTSNEFKNEVIYLYK